MLAARHHAEAERIGGLTLALADQDELDRLIIEAHEDGEHIKFPIPLECSLCEDMEEQIRVQKLGWKRKCT